MELWNVLASVMGSFLLVPVLVIIVQRCTILWKYRKFPGTPGAHRFLVGDLPEIIKKDISIFTDDMYQRFAGKCKAFKMFVGPNAMVVLTDVDLARRAMMRYTNRPSNLRTMNLKEGMGRKVAQNSLVHQRGDKWRAMRKATETVFMHSSALDAQVPVLQLVTQRAADLMHPYAVSGEPMDVLPIMCHMALDATGFAAFGVDMKATLPDKPTAVAADAPASPTPALNGMPVDGVTIVESSRTINAPGQPRPVSFSPSTKATAAAAERTRTVTVGNTHDVSSVNAGVGRDDIVEDGFWEKYPVGSTKFGHNLIHCSNSHMNDNNPKVATRYLPLLMLFPELRPLIRLLVKYFPDDRQMKSRAASQAFWQALLKITELWRDGQDATGQGGSDSGTGGGGEGVSKQGLLARILSNEDDMLSHRQFKDYEVLGLVHSSVVGGFETTGSTLSMALFLLASNMDKQQALHQELDNVLHDNKDPSIQDLGNLPYVDAVWKETLRLYPAATAVIRDVTDCELDVGDDIKIPEGTQLLMPIYSYMRDSDYWPQPNQFLPERHLLGHDSIAATNPNIWLPFGYGARMCVGYKFANMEGKLALTRLLQRFRFERAPGEAEPVLKTAVTYKPDRVILKVFLRSV